MPRAEKSQQATAALSLGGVGITLGDMDAGLRHGRYRLRTFLRGNLPYVLSDHIPKGPRDCGNHEWYRQDALTEACYHCEVGRRPVRKETHGDQAERTPVSV